MEYLEIVKTVIRHFICFYGGETYKPVSEADVQCYVFALCINEFKKNMCEENIHANVKSKILGENKRIDLIVNNEIAIEIKFEADNEVVSKPVTENKEVEKDIKRLRLLKNGGYKHCVFFMIDESGKRYNSLNKNGVCKKEEWEKIVVNGKERFILNLYL